MQLNFDAFNFDAGFYINIICIVDLQYVLKF